MVEDPLKVTLANLPVDRINTRRVNLNQNFACSRFGTGGVFIGENISPTECVNSYCFHYLFSIDRLR